MIHFDFIVEDGDAELIFECINSTINQANRMRLFRSATQAETEWLSKHVDYLNALKEKMSNKLVREYDVNKDVWVGGSVTLKKVKQLLAAL
jgi:hypothetical protein